MIRNSFFSAALLFVVAALFTACGGNDAAKTATEAPKGLSGAMAVNTSASKVIWKGDMLNMYSHEGTLDLTAADLTLDNGVVKGGSFTVNMASIKPTDKGYDAENTQEKLVGHLSSPAFFDVANHPTATFVVTGAEGNKVMGNLTLRGKTNPEVVENVTITPTEGGATITGKLTFDRQKYDVKFAMPVGEKVLSDKIDLNIELAASAK